MFSNNSEHLSPRKKRMLLVREHTVKNCALILHDWLAVVWIFSNIPMEILAVICKSTSNLRKHQICWINKWIDRYFINIFPTIQKNCAIILDCWDFLENFDMHTSCKSKSLRIDMILFCCNFYYWFKYVFINLLIQQNV